MTRPVFIAAPFVIIVMVFMTTTTAFGVNFYDGARAKEGTYFLTYTSLYVADEIDDAKANKIKSDYGLKKVDEILRLCYYSPDFVATALVPFGYMDIGSIKQDNNGLGDVNIGVGYFLPIRSVDILPMFFVKFPTGEYNQEKVANIGSNQYDARPMVFLYKALGDYSIDAVAKYFLRMKNDKTGTLPGDEFHLQCLLGYQLTKNFKLGPSFSWMISQDREQNNVKVANSRREILSGGADIYYRFSKISVTFTYLADIYVENTTKGHFFQIKAVYCF